MLNDWFYSHSTWQVAAAICSLLVILPLLGLMLFHRLVHVHLRQPDTSMVGLSYALCGGLYAVVLAFVAVGTYEALEKSTAIASMEANSLGELAFDSAGLPDEAAVRIRSEVDRYIETVVKKEWPNQRAFKMEERNFEEGWSQLRGMAVGLSNFEPSTQGQATVKQAMMSAMNNLFSERRARLLAANSHLPDIVWQMLLCGLVFVVGYLYLFGPHNFRVHLSVVTLTMLIIGLSFSLLVALDYPFRGDLSVDTEAYEQVKEVSAHAFGSEGKKE
jgi:hypothetical protein